jgi:hypothetical protein
MLFLLKKQGLSHEGFMTMITGQGLGIGSVKADVDYAISALKVLARNLPRGTI